MPTGTPQPQRRRTNHTPVVGRRRPSEEIKKTIEVTPVTGGKKKARRKA